ncbi:MAG TPA: hypothetical protein VLE44_01635 [Candidatus Saccharimonadales bacterium]|nr:hypothetical protein [Candidatus Saccharimonadales bacterium]
MEIRDAVALTIWWCEGAKLRKDKRWKNSFLYQIEVTNTDSRIIKIFLKYLREKHLVPLSRIKGQLQIHKGDNKDDLENYWSKELGLPLDQFNKTIVRLKGKKPDKTKGTFKLRFYNKNIFLLLQKDLDLLLS